MVKLRLGGISGQKSISGPPTQIISLGQRQCRFIIANLRTTALRRPRLADNRTGTTFRHRQSRAHVLNARSHAARLSIFPRALPSGLSCPASVRRPPSSGTGSLAQRPLAAMPVNLQSAVQTAPSLVTPKDLANFLALHTRISASRILPIACSSVYSFRAIQTPSKAQNSRTLALGAPPRRGSRPVIPCACTAKQPPSNLQVGTP